MRVLYVCHLYYPSFGGNRAQGQGFSETLTKLGEDVTVLTVNVMQPSQLYRRDPHYRPLPRREVVNGVAIRRFTPCHGLRGIFHRVAPLLSYAAQRCGATRFVHALDLAKSRYPFVPHMLWAIWRHHPDIILANNGFPFTTFLCYLARKWFGYPLAIRTTTHIAQGWHKHPFQREIYRVADRLIANTDFERDVIVQLGIDANKIATIGNGIDPAPFRGAEAAAFRSRYGLGTDKVVAFVGRKVAGKGVEHLIDAMRIVWAQFPPVHLVIAGQYDRHTAKPIRAKISALEPQEAEKLIDLDDFPEKDKPQIYAACDVFVMASNADSFGVVYLEAWASGKPVIACRDTPQETFIEHERDGLLVEYGNVNELAAAIMRMLGDDVLRARLGANGRRKVSRNYTWDIIGRKLRDE
jgi:glycosyltransferase involved in cell wall biosynthesis